mgnify:CR=1 FL=1
MLENSLAEKLIEQVTKYTSYNVNIMNEQGVIIASRNPERIGKFHEVAWQIVHGTSDIMVTENDNEYPGVLSGINMVIDIEGKREGGSRCNGKSGRNSSHCLNHQNGN